MVHLRSCKTRHLLNSDVFNEVFHLAFFFPIFFFGKKELSTKHSTISFYSQQQWQSLAVKTEIQQLKHARVHQGNGIIRGSQRDLKSVMDGIEIATKSGFKLYNSHKSIMKLQLCGQFHQLLQYLDNVTQNQQSNPLKSIIIDSKHQYP